MKITGDMLLNKLLEISKENAPVRLINDAKNKRPKKRAVGKIGTNMYSPYPGNLKNNGIYRRGNAIVFDYNKVGYIGYANLRSKRPQYIEKSVNDFLNYCVLLGGRIEKR